ncbi:hypothetical protein B9Z65_2390 [Elsinoe australis]|uniref:Uncharacterized protein n=1 Tax=Elsinoe australis TaxID=40998 RepID=A0A2P7ZAL6_9PEZI|nr:hypothetical protein B9Z65_2390 [Elsinoe australis]
MPLPSPTRAGPTVSPAASSITFYETSELCPMKCGGTKWPWWYVEGEPGCPVNTNKVCKEDAVVLKKKDAYGLYEDKMKLEAKVRSLEEKVNQRDREKKYIKEKVKQCREDENKAVIKINSLGRQLYEQKKQIGTTRTVTVQVTVTASAKPTISAKSTSTANTSSSKKTESPTTTTVKPVTSGAGKAASTTNTTKPIVLTISNGTIVVTKSTKTVTSTGKPVMTISSKA